MNQPKIDLSPKVSDEVRKTTCYMCACRCGINVHMKGGKVAYIEGNRDHPVNQGVLCAKGSAGIMQVNAPSRLRAPLKRVGERGSGEFEEISWDEALQIATDWLAPVRERGVRDARALPLPARKDEAWRYTSLDGLLGQTFVPVSEPFTALDHASRERMEGIFDRHCQPGIDGHAAVAATATDATKSVPWTHRKPNYFLRFRSTDDDSHLPGRRVRRRTVRRQPCRRLHPGGVDRRCHHAGDCRGEQFVGNRVFRAQRRGLSHQVVHPEKRGRFMWTRNPGDRICLVPCSWL